MCRSVTNTIQINLINAISYNIMPFYILSINGVVLSHTEGWIIFLKLLPTKIVIFCYQI